MGQKSIYDLGLHESAQLGCNALGAYQAIRVASGWIYEFWSDDVSIERIFVPYSEEFKDPAPSPAQQWLDKSDDQLRLQLGELTPDDIRLVRAVLGAVAREGEHGNA